MAATPSMDEQRTMAAPAHGPQVTVLMTLYNKGPWVEEAVQSVLEQTHADWELLVVDDASTDDGLERVKRLADPRVRILASKENTGRAAAANRGYDAARGEYIAVLDADDRMHPERLERQLRFMQAHPEVGALGSWSAILGRGGDPVKMPLQDAECRASALFNIPVNYPSVMLRRSILEQHGLRCDATWKTPGMDYLFMLHVGKHTAYANLPEPLLYYRQGANNMRAGHDRLHARKTLEQAIFRLYGIRATEREQELHLAFNNVWPRPPRARDVRDLWRWAKRLAELNRAGRIFPIAPFEAELERRWNALFHYYADHGMGPALAHLRLCRKERLQRALYLAKVTAMQRRHNRQGDH